MAYNSSIFANVRYLFPCDNIFNLFLLNYLFKKTRLIFSSANTTKRLTHQVWNDLFMFNKITERKRVRRNRSSIVAMQPGPQS